MWINILLIIVSAWSIAEGYLLYRVLLRLSDQNDALSSKGKVLDVIATQLIKLMHVLRIQYSLVDINGKNYQLSLDHKTEQITITELTLEELKMLQAEIEENRLQQTNNIH